MIQILKDIFTLKFITMLLFTIAVYLNLDTNPLKSIALVGMMIFIEVATKKQTTINVYNKIDSND